MMNRRNVGFDIAKILEKLEINDESGRFANIASSPSIFIAQKRLEDLKKEVLKQRRLLAKKYHPDLNPINEGRMKEINSIVDFVRSLRIEVPQIQRVTVYCGFGGFGGTSATYSDTTYTNSTW